MSAVIDATTLAYLVTSDASAPIDPTTGEQVARAKDRIEHLIAQLDREKTTLIVPTPALGEVLVVAGDTGPAMLDRISRSARIRVANFDTRAAVEVAAMTREAIRKGDKFDGADGPWQKVKIDRQIIAIARVNGADTIYSDDKNLAKFGQALGLRVVPLRSLALPEEPEPDLFSGMNPA